jgi:formate hydrogenlyase subunit 2
VEGAVQLNESLCVSCKLCGIACPFGAIEFSGSRPIHIPANANSPKAPPAPPAPARVSTLLDWVPGIRAIAVKCDLCSFDADGPACVRTCPTKALRVVDNNDIAASSKRKREQALGASLGDLTLLTQPGAEK